MENSYIVLGNGFSIDLVQKMEKAEEIDLANLFSKGEHVLYPKTNTRGFLSRKYTPDLWNLGARTYMPYEAATQLVTDVITCANVYNLSVEKRPNEERDSSNIYIHAYSELSSYLRYLFIYYDSLVSEKDLKNIIDEIELIHYIKNRVLRQKKVYIMEDVGFITELYIMTVENTIFDGNENEIDKVFADIVDKYDEECSISVRMKFEKNINLLKEWNIDYSAYNIEGVSHLYALWYLALYISNNQINADDICDKMNIFYRNLRSDKTIPQTVIYQQSMQSASRSKSARKKRVNAILTYLEYEKL